MKPCWLARTLSLADPCDGRWDLAHIGFSETWLMNSPTGPHLTKEQANDPRLLQTCCRKHHGRLDKHILRLTRDQLPSAVEAFAAEHNLEWKLDLEHEPREGHDERLAQHQLRSTGPQSEAAVGTPTDFLRADERTPEPLTPRREPKPYRLPFLRR